jgi:hydroxyacid-oxoacid transhydrogenase
MLVEGTLPQRRVLDLAPGIGDVYGSDGKEHLTRIMESSLEY